IGDSIDILMFGDDLGTQNTTMISRDLYKQLIYPRQKKLFQYVHDHSNAKVFLHSCGAIYDIIGDLIDAGVDILNPVQIGATGMEPKRLKEEYGKDVVFWGGGIDTQHVLASGTPSEIRESVKRNCDIFMKDGGFVFNQVHNIVDGVPPENIIAMYDAVNTFSG
ncbi:MAG: uroporphyrinogen decarboxylase family protein, partial [Sphaerochaetaceae bacterium]|nr:uroporphyrinogen decarboxylase family protein [Sphaerochaetaceae bacterium]